MVRNDQGWFTTPPFSEPEMFDFPAGIGPVECVNIEHEEVLLMTHWVKARATPALNVPVSVSGDARPSSQR